MIETYRRASTTRLLSALFTGVIYVALILLGVIALMPLLLALSNSFKQWSGFLRVPPEWLPSVPVLDNYKYLFLKEFRDISGSIVRSGIAASFWRWIFNTVFVAAVVTTANLFFGTLSGYAFAKMRAAGREFLFWLGMSLLLFPPIFNLVPLYQMIVTWGWLNTYWALIVPQIGGNMFLSRQFISRLPSSLIDAARMDGSSEFKIYRRVILPLSKPLVAILAIFGFIGQWNSFRWPLIVTQSTDMRLIQVGLALLTRGEGGTNLSTMMAGAIVTALPMFVIFFVFQNYFMKGLTAGAMKW